jgi:hypothetical protein
VERDPELSQEEHCGVRRVLEARYAERLRLFNVG